jgi:hypothetical protein
MLADTLLLAGLLPFAASAALALFLRQLRVSPPAVWTWGIASGFIVGMVALKSPAGFAAALRSFAMPRDAADWLPIIILLVLGASLLFLSTPPSRLRLVIALAAIQSIAIPVRLLSGNVRLTHDQWSPVEKVTYLLLLAGTLGLVWRLLAASSEERQTSLRQPFLLLVAVGTAIVLTLSGVLIYGQYCGAIAAALTGTALACIRSGATGSASAYGLSGATGSPGLSLSKSASARARFESIGISGAAGVLTFSLGSLIILGHFFASLSSTNAVLLFISLAAAGSAFPATFANRPLWQQLATRAAFCLTPLAFAITDAAS